jgi:hypothetical protein
LIKKHLMCVHVDTNSIVSRRDDDIRIINFKSSTYMQCIHTLNGQIKVQGQYRHTFQFELNASSLCEKKHVLSFSCDWSLFSTSRMTRSVCNRNNQRWQLLSRRSNKQKKIKTRRVNEKVSETSGWTVQLDLITHV